MRPGLFWLQFLVKTIMLLNLEIVRTHLRVLARFPDRVSSSKMGEPP